MNNPKKFLHRIDECPPFLVYALFRSRYPQKLTPYRVDVERAAKRVGLSERTFFRIARRLTWESVTVENMVLFCEACKVNIFRRRDFRERLLNNWRQPNPFPHLDARMRRDFNLRCAEWVQRQEARA